MSNKELIETAKQAMKDLWEVNKGRLLEHEQAAYNCLRLFCERMPVEGGETAQSISQAVCMEYVAEETVQLQITVQTDENEFIEDFTTVINRLYFA